jgi:hypothetical protein
MCFLNILIKTFVVADRPTVHTCIHIPHDCYSRHADDAVGKKSKICKVICEFRNGIEESDTPPPHTHTYSSLNLGSGSHRTLIHMTLVDTHPMGM